MQIRINPWWRASGHLKCKSSIVACKKWIYGKLILLCPLSVHEIKKKHPCHYHQLKPNTINYTDIIYKIDNSTCRSRCMHGKQTLQYYEELFYVVKTRERLKNWDPFHLNRDVHTFRDKLKFITEAYFYIHVIIAYSIKVLYDLLGCWSFVPNYFCGSQICFIFCWKPHTNPVVYVFTNSVDKNNILSRTVITLGWISVYTNTFSKILTIVFQIEIKL